MYSPAEQAEAALKIVRNTEELSYDTETSGLDWKRNFPVGYVIGDGVDTFYIPVRHGGGGNLADPKGCKVPETSTDDWNIHSFERELAKSFEERKAKKLLTVGHHIKFDAHFSANAEIYLGRGLSCTQNNQALIDEHSKSFSLDAVAKYHKVTAKKGEELYQHLANQFGVPATRSAMSEFWRLAGNDPIGSEYAIGDGVTTLEVYKAQKRELLSVDEWGFDRKQVWELENELIWTLFRIERRGIKIDTQYLGQTIEELEKGIEEALSILPDNFNPRSPIQMQRYIEQYRNDWPTTEKGNPSFTEKWLKTFPEGKPIVDLRKNTNLINSFMRPMLETHQYEGRVHATLNQLKADEHGTVSGRFSCSHPNLQQVPKHNKPLAKLFRKGFVADEGFEFYEGDYSQCEPRLFAHYSGDENLLDGYNATPPKDVHTIVAEMLNKNRATTAKRMNMGMFTGMYPKSFSGHMGVTIPEAKDLWDQWHGLFPKVKPFQDAAKTNILARGYIYTLLRRRCHLDNPRFAYKATSKIIQGGNADIIKYKLLEIDKWLEERGDMSHLLMTVHDSFVWQSPATEEGRQEAEAIVEIMGRVQCEPFNLRVPFTTDLDRGKNWSEASFGAE